MKGTYYDPAKYGPGLDGYWLFPGSSNVPLVPGKPEDGGQTNAGLPINTGLPVQAGSYPNVASPWGLLDSSGGMAEWLEGFGAGTGPDVKGTNYGQDLIELFDRLDIGPFGASPDVSFPGLRLATTIPSPAGLACLAWLLLSGVVRRR